MLSTHLEQKIKDLPQNPGVYIMKDANGHILYVGKARNLKNRVRQYFGSPKNKTEKVLIMVSKISTFDYIITNNEIEALVLENTLIKKHQPPYNILLKDDKNYPFIKINLKDKYPRVEVVRKLRKDGSKYFGPYMIGITTKDIFDLIYSAFSLRSCKLNMDKIPRNQRPCLNYHIKRCYAPCCGLVSQEEYAKEIDATIKFLNGYDKDISQILTDKMNAAAQDEDYEQAIFYRDKLNVLDKLVRKQVTALASDMDMDIFAIMADGINTVIAILFVRGGKLIGSDKQLVTDANIDQKSALDTYIFDYYQHNPTVPSIILTNIETDGSQEIAEYYSQNVGAKINIVTPIQGVRKQLMDMAENNAKDYLEKCVSIAERKENMTIGSLKVLKDTLGLDKMPYRMECFDISHISGTDMVASMAVFVNGEASPKMYRKFRIKTVESNNDFACMKEVLIRRFRELVKSEDTSFAERPDLIVVDGGLGQLSYAEEAQQETEQDLEMISLAEKDEEVYLRNRQKIVLDKRNMGLMTLQRLRDEAHRFAVSFHQQLRAKRQTDSELMKIAGVGKNTVIALREHFKSISKIKAATIEELCAVKGLAKKVAQNIYDTYHSAPNSCESEEVSDRQ